MPGLAEVAGCDDGIPYPVDAAAAQGFLATAPYMAMSRPLMPVCSGPGRQECTWVTPGSCSSRSLPSHALALPYLLIFSSHRTVRLVQARSPPVPLDILVFQY